MSIAYRLKINTQQPSSDETLKRFSIHIVVVLLMFSGFSCSKDTDPITTSSGGTVTTITDTTTSTATHEGNTDTAANEDDLIANSTFSSIVTISFGSTVDITNPLAGNGVEVAVSNGDVVVNSTAEEVEYVLTGTTTNGSVKLYSETKFKLTLNGVSIANADGPAINIQSHKRVFVVLADNDTNTLTDGTTYTAYQEEDMKGTFFSEGQLIVSGGGSLSVKSKFKHGICSDEYFRMISGTITVTGAASDGIHTNDAFIADGGVINVTSSNDGIQCEQGYIVINGGTFTINSGDKGISAAYDVDNTIDPYLTINGGTINVTSTAGEGIESKSTLTINNGTITTKTSDDGINASDAMYINGGVIYAYSSSNDAIDSNGTLTVTGGTIVAVGTLAPEEGFDCDHNTFKITGGTLVGIAGASSAPTASVCKQPSVLLGSGSANKLINIQSSDGVEALTFLIPRSYSTMLFSSSKLKSGTTYAVYSGGSVTSGTTVNGIYTAGEYTPGTKSASFTVSSMFTKAGGSIGPG
jgi:hypothetical protein